MTQGKAEDPWFLVTIYDPLALPGHSLHKVVKLILQIIQIKYVLMSDLQGAGISHLVDDVEDSILEIDEFLNRIDHVNQFDWGDFFLFTTFPSKHSTFDKKSYADVIGLTDTTVRAIDDSYIYVYTPYKELVELIKNFYKIDEIKREKLINLNYPF